MNRPASLRLLRIVSLLLLVTTGLLAVGCDSGGANGSGSDNGGNETTAPAAPSGLSASASDGAVELTWTAVEADDLDGYNVYRSTSSFDDVSGLDPQNDTPLSDTSYTDDGLTNDTTYHYRITAVGDADNESEPSNEISATPSASSSLSGTIAFASRDPGAENDIYTKSLDDSALQQLTTNSADDVSPDWSADGSMIAFESGRDGEFNTEIYVMASDGSSMQRLTENSAYDYAPSWSPDGSRIAFSSDREGDTHDIYTMKPDGSDLQKLTDGVESSLNPTWSPDGSRIAFGRAEDLYTIKSDGTDLQQLTSGSDADEDPAWSPDGSTLAFTRNQDNGTYNPEIYTIGTDGSKPTRITNELGSEQGPSDVGPTWKPDGSRILFSSERNNNFEVYMIKPDGTDPVNLTSNSGRPDFGGVWKP